MSLKDEDYDPGILMEEISTSVTFAGVMSAATFFAVPILLVYYRDALFSSLFYLIISMFGYLYSVLIYANAAGLFRLVSTKSQSSDRNRKIKKGCKVMQVGNIISEYFGVYYTAIAFPLVFLVFAGPILGTLTFVVVVVGIVFYHWYRIEGEGFSIIERYALKPKSRFQWRFHVAVSLFIALFSLNYFLNLFSNGNILNPGTYFSTACSRCVHHGVGLSLSQTRRIIGYLALEWKLILVIMP